MTTEPADSVVPIGELLRAAMRSWVTGVTIVTSRFESVAHGMTANSFGSISLDPPLVTVTMNHDTRTFALVEQSGVFAVTILSAGQQPLAERFAGRAPEPGDRLAGVEAFALETGAPLLVGGLAYIDCRVVHRYTMARSTLLVGQVVAVQTAVPAPPALIYYNRTFFHLE
jgi:flavin reductase (DIM6/NTAB) family NADH-FMN oxidoreductase RutF